LNARNRRKAARLRTVSELYPEIIDAEAGEDPLPSCSAVEALDRQEPFINQTLASSALAMLARLFRYGKLTHHGGFFNAQRAMSRVARRSSTLVEDAATRSATVIPVNQVPSGEKSMFKELAPVLRDRAVLLTVTLVDADQIRVNIVPKKLKDGDNDALTTPLSVTGTAEDLDAELSTTIVSFVGSHLQMKNTLEKAKAEMDAASKAAQAEARAKSKTPAKTAPPNTEVTQNAPTAKPAEPAKPAPRSPQASSICRHRRPQPPPRQPNRKMTLDLQKSTMTNQSKRSKNWMTRPDGQHSSLQEGCG
jgi:PRTRC genetic system protein E